MITSVINDEGVPVEISPGRGDLRYGSVPSMYPLKRSLRLVDRTVSFARVYTEQPMIAAVVGWLLRQATRVPLKVYRRSGEESRLRLRPEDHRLAAALITPWERGGQLELIRELLGSILIHGNTVCTLDQGRSGTLTFGPKDWRYCTPLMPWRDSIAGWAVDIDNPEVRQTVGADTVLHVSYYSPLGPLGISPLQQLGISIAIEDAATRYQRAMFRNGARPPSAIQASTDFLNLSAEERAELMDNLREDIDELFASPDNAGRPPILPPGLEWKQVGHTAVEAQLIEQRTVTRQEAISVYGLNPAAIGIIMRGGELPMQRQMAYVDGLAPPLLMIEAALNAQLVRALLREEDIYVEFDFAGILRGDPLQEVEALRASIASALRTPNESRSILNLPRSDVPGMDEFYLPRNNLWPLAVPYPAKGMGGEGAEGSTPPSDEPKPEDEPKPDEEPKDKGKPGEKPEPTKTGG